MYNGEEIKCLGGKLGFYDSGNRGDLVCSGARGFEDGLVRKGFLEGRVFLLSSGVALELGGILSRVFKFEG